MILYVYNAETNEVVAQSRATITPRVRL